MTPATPVSFNEALACILKTAGRQSVAWISDNTRELATLRAVGRVCAENLSSREMVPPHANSGVDGFAVRAAETVGASSEKPIVFRVVGSIVAGDIPPSIADARQTASAFEIMTGAPFPEGFDASVKIEDIEVRRDSRGRPIEVILTRTVDREENLRAAGEDFQPGTAVIAAGTVILPEHVLALSTLGFDSIQVLKKPRVAVVSTGCELANPGEKPAPGQIRNSTTPFLLAAIPLLGAKVISHHRVADDPAAFMEAMERVLLEQPDVIITTGAVSMGKHDFVAPALRDMGAQILFHRVAIRPGMPNLFAKFGSRETDSKIEPVVFGLPGNPVSTVVGLRFLVEPYLRALQGRKAEKPTRARLKNRVRRPKDLRCFFKAHLESGPGGAEVTVLAGQPSFMVRPLLESTAWAVLPEGPEANELLEGEVLDVYPLHSTNWSRGAGEAGNAHAEKGCCS